MILLDEVKSNIMWMRSNHTLVILKQHTDIAKIKGMF
jgi:hypothetical protein